MEFCGRGGKRLRPRLCRAVFGILGGESGADFEGVCEAIECFHKASLIHDDLQDSEETRYGKPAVWKEHGIALAIAAGDWLVARGYGLIVRHGGAASSAMLEETVRSHLELCEGQGDDLAVALGTYGRFPRVCDEYLSVCRRKTGEPFALAAALGALAAGADPAPFRKYGLDFGVLFQLRDDIADGEAPEGAEAYAEKLAAELASSEAAKSLGEWYGRNSIS